MLRDTLGKAEKAKEKKALYGEDIDLEKFIKEEAGDHEKVSRANEVPKKVQDTLIKVGVDPNEQERSGTFIQMDQSGVCTTCASESVEIMGMNVALDKYDWIKDYMWKAVAVETDKYTAQTALRESKEGASGYFIRSLPGSKEVFPLQACMFIGDQDVMQTAHNVIIAEENSELHIITGCATGEDVSSIHIRGSKRFCSGYWIKSFTGRTRIQCRDDFTGGFQRSVPTLCKGTLGRANPKC